MYEHKPLNALNGTLENGMWVIILTMARQFITRHTYHIFCCVIFTPQHQRLCTFRVFSWVCCGVVVRSFHHIDSVVHLISRMQNTLAIKYPFSWKFWKPLEKVNSNALTKHCKTPSSPSLPVAKYFNSIQNVGQLDQEVLMKRAFPSVDSTSTRTEKQFQFYLKMFLFSLSLSFPSTPFISDHFLITLETFQQFQICITIESI